MDPDRRRAEMVRRQIRARGVRDPRVLEAMRTVPREAFVPEDLRDRACDDAALPIGEGQTISQPYVVALMAEALDLRADDRVLEVGAGSGYAAAIYGRLAMEVVAVERHAALAAEARARMERLGYDTVHVVHADGSGGWPDAAPYDAIAVAAGGPRIAEALLAQLAPNGRLVMPVGEDRRSQELLRIHRRPDGGLERESLGPVRFVPLVGAQGWTESGEDAAAVAGPDEEDREPARPLAGGEPVRPGEPAPANDEPPADPALAPSVALERARAAGDPEGELAALVAAAAEPFAEIDDAEVGPLIDRIASARVVMLGECTHGTAEFHRLRARITRILLEEHGFDAVCLEGDWPDVGTLDRRVRGRPPLGLRTPPFSRFPTWMWRNEEVESFVRWLEARNADRPPEDRVALHGLDLYSLHASIGAVIDFLEDRDPEAASEARELYACFAPWERDPATYGRIAASGRMRGCADEVTTVLVELFRRRGRLMAGDGDELFDAERNATLVREAERYYRIMYEGSSDAWNLRDLHMLDTLEAVLAHHGDDAKLVVWAHDVHVGDAAGTEMGARQEVSLGGLARRSLGHDAVRLVGLGTDRGAVFAAEAWDGPGRVMTLRPSPPDGVGHLMHRTGIERFVLPLRPEHLASDVRRGLLESRLGRAIGVVYRPGTERASHGLRTVLPEQFDEYVWIDETRAITPLAEPPAPGRADAAEDDVPATWPHGV